MTSFRLTGLLRRSPATAGLLYRGLVLAAVAVVFSLAVGCGENSPDGDDAAPAGAQSFVSSIERPAVVWAVGDGGTDSPEAARVARAIAEADPDRLLYLGDVYDEGTAEDFETNYEPTYGRLKALTAPTPGNHDAPSADQGYNPYWEEALGASPPPYYAFRVSGWQVLSLNSEIDHGAGSPQRAWLDDQVTSGGDCRIAFWHRPRFSAGVGRGDQPDIDPLWDALRDRARIVLNGHEHDMQRLRRDGRQRIGFAGAFDEANGVAIQDDGKIVAVGSTGGDFALARYNPNGSHRQGTS